MTYNVFSGTLNPTHFTSLGDRLATIDMARKVGDAVPLFVGESWVPI